MAPPLTDSSNKGVSGKYLPTKDTLWGAQTGLSHSVSTFTSEMWTTSLQWTAWQASMCPLLRDSTLLYRRMHSSKPCTQSQPQDCHIHVHKSHEMSTHYSYSTPTSQEHLYRTTTYIRLVQCMYTHHQLTYVCPLYSFTQRIPIWVHWERVHVCIVCAMCTLCMCVHTQVWSPTYTYLFNMKLY